MGEKLDSMDQSDKLMRADKEELTRFGVSMPQELAEQFDVFVEEQRYANRSEAIRDLVRRALIRPDRLSPNRPVAGTIVLVYDHHVRELPSFLMDEQHRYHHEICSTMHIHLNHDQCLEILVVRGSYGRLRELRRRLQAHKGVTYAELSVTHVESGHDLGGTRSGGHHHDHHHPDDHLDHHHDPRHP